MPFGMIFGALFFGVFCTLFGLRLLLHPLPQAKLGGLFLVALCGSLALGLLLQRGWSRRLGLFAAAALAAVGLRLILLRGDVVDHLMFLAALGTALLLALPATGALRVDPRSRPAGARRLGLLEAGAALGLIGSLAVTGWLGLSPPDRSVGSSSALPAAAIGRSLRWSDFGAGLERSRREGKPVLATFVTDWCPYCSKMNKTTWRASDVVAGLGGVVPVRVDAEERTERNGFSGAELAARYGVRSYPTQLLLDSEGGLISRYDGYQTSRQLLGWIEAAATQGSGN